MTFAGYLGKLEKPTHREIHESRPKLLLLEKIIPVNSVTEIFFIDNAVL